MSAPRTRVITPLARPLREVREERDITLRALAQASGIARPILSQIETGLRSATVREQRLIGAALGIPSHRITLRSYLVIEDAP